MNEHLRFGVMKAAASNNRALTSCKQGLNIHGYTTIFSTIQTENRTKMKNRHEKVSADTDFYLLLSLVLCVGDSAVQQGPQQDTNQISPGN